MDEKKFRTFMDLDIWKAARELRKKFYEIARRLPVEEKFGLVSQMRRAAVSVTNNIAEGHGRYHYQENIQFLRHSRGSLEELLDDLTVCSDEQYLEVTEIKGVEMEIGRVRALLNAYIRYLKERKESAPGTVRETPAEYTTDAEDDF
jgi:four helix bundle protein